MPFGTVNFIRKGDGEIMNEPVIELKHITKRFAKVLANDDVSITIHKGEVVALLGENGAGKSTIMKILYGLYHATSGEIWIDGKERKIATPKEAMDAGISMIQQHFSLVPAHTVTENIILGNCKGKLDIKKKEKEIQALAEQYGFQVPAGEYVKNLSVGTQQKVEILKALYLNARVLIMDEPTAVLTPQEIDTLMEFVRRYVEKGNSVVFITHKMREVMAVSDTIVVMRNGSICGTVKKTDTSETELAHMMIGHELETLEKPGTEDMSNRRVRLAVKDLSIKPKGHTPLLEDINFEIHEGDLREFPTMDSRNSVRRSTEESRSHPAGSNWTERMSQTNLSKTGSNLVWDMRQQTVIVMEWLQRCPCPKTCSSNPVT